jgi:hypothetical protein
MVVQLLYIDDLIGRPTTGKNRALLEELKPFPLLHYKLRLLIRRIRHAPTADKLAIQAMAHTLFHLDRNFSHIFKKQQRHLLYKAIQIPPSYAAH